MTVPTHTSEPEASSLTVRRRERRQAFAELLGALTRHLEHAGDVAHLRGAFETMVRRMVPARIIQLREVGGRWPIGAGTTPGAESIAFEVPRVDGAPPSVLEAIFDAGAQVGEWDFQMLGLATHVAALVLEVERGRQQLAQATLGAPVRARRDGAAPLIGSTQAIARLRATIERVAATDFTILIEGESGVGKELVARQIHDLSRRRGGPFVALNCAALVETLLEAELFGIEERTATGVRGRRGKFEHADGGTLFLDEVSDLSLSAQAKLLRAIQDLSVERVGGNGAHRVDIRIVAATNRSLAGLVERQLFRPDLFYRLSGVDVPVPPLRERREDILELAGYFLDRHRTSRSLRVSASAADALQSYGWPGNVRELERLMERAVALAASDVIELDDLPPTVRGDYPAAVVPSLERNESMRAWGARYARLVVERCSGRKRKACRVLGISYHTLQAYLRFAEQDGAAWTHAAGENEAEQTETGDRVATAADA